MKLSISPLLFSLGLGVLALAGFVQLSAAPTTCDPQSEPPTCPVVEYPILKVVVDPTEIEDPCTLGACAPIGQALEPTLYCDVSGDAVECLAGPLTAETEYPVSYRWKRTGSLVGAGGGWSAWTLNPARTFTCRAGPNPVGTVTVAVRSPYNLESSTTLVINCPVVPY